MHQPSNTDLKEFISQSKVRLKKILDRLEWSEEFTIKDYNTNSAASCFKRDLQKTRTPIIATYPASCITKNSLVLETSKLQEILQNNELKAPQNFTELQRNFCREQKLKIYEHVIANTHKLENNTVDQCAEGEISLADILAQKKLEEKRKKRRFRKSKPTQVEEVRCLVDIQMQALQQFMGNKNKKGHTESAKNYGIATEDKSRGESKRYEDYYRRDNGTKFTEHQIQPDGLRKRRRSSSNEYFRHKHRQDKKSSSKDFAYCRTKQSRSRSKERRIQRTFSRNICKEKTRRSRSNSRNISKNEREKRQSRSYERRNGSENKEISKERQKHRRSHSYDNNHTKYSEEESHKEKYYRKDIKSSNSGSFKQQVIRETRKVGYCEDEYNKSHQSKTKRSGSFEKYSHGEEYKTHVKTKENLSNYKSSKHKKKKRKRDR